MILGLEYLHSKRIYHKDIKPQNILISNNVNYLLLYKYIQGHFKLTDFGLSEIEYSGENLYVISNEESNTENTETEQNFFIENDPSSPEIKQFKGKFCKRSSIKLGGFGIIEAIERPEEHSPLKKSRSKNFYYKKKLSDLNLDMILNSVKPKTVEKLLGIQTYGLYI